MWQTLDNNYSKKTPPQGRSRPQDARIRTYVLVLTSGHFSTKEPRSQSRIVTFSGKFPVIVILKRSEESLVDAATDND